MQCVKSKARTSVMSKKLVFYGYLNKRGLTIYEYAKMVSRLMTYFLTAKREDTHLKITFEIQVELKTHPQLKYYYGFLIPSLQLHTLETKGEFWNDDRCDLQLKTETEFGVYEKAKVEGYVLEIFKAKEKRSATKEEVVVLLDKATAYLLTIGAITEEMVNRNNNLRNE